MRQKVDTIQNQVTKERDSNIEHFKKEDSIKGITGALQGQEVDYTVTLP
ncbi:hypothetical protein HC766_02300 [Candidatus Gracilibacteria bacterium]|nr:hypothetical protein [Candidatus Gracilibacteria bacterium]